MAVQISGNDITVPRDTTVTRNLTVGGVLTYEDVTNVDSVGLVTARSGIEIGARPGVAASIRVDGNMIISGISTFGDDITFTGATSGRDVVLTYFSPIVDTHIVYLSEDGHKNMSAYSSAGGKYTGDGNFIVVGTEASFDMLISSGLKTISVKSCTKVRVGIPNSIVASCTVSLAVSSFDAKYTSKDVKNAPDSFSAKMLEIDDYTMDQVNCENK